MADYFRPLVQIGHARPTDAITLAGGRGWFTHVEHLRRDGPAVICPAAALPADWHHRLSTPRATIDGLGWDAPVLMGILNVTPDSFSDGGSHDGLADALVHGQAMANAGAGIIDIGGESTRPGAKAVPVRDEIARTAPVITALRGAGLATPISIDTRKAPVAEAALAAGATLVNDVAGFTHDPALAPLCARSGAAVCVMHAQGDPATMQDDPCYDHVLLDVFDFLAARIDALVAIGIPRSRIIADPGIGFGKRLQHNLTLLAGLSLFHGLGVPILLGASRKGFIGKLGHAPDPAVRAPGSIAVGLAALAQGVQILRVHDVPETLQAVALWRAVTETGVE